MTSQKDEAEDSQVIEPSFVAVPRDVDPEATVVDTRGKPSAEAPAKPVAVDDDPEETRLDARPRFPAAKAAEAPAEALDDEATRIKPKSDPPQVASPAHRPAAIPAAMPPRSSRVPLLLILLAIVGTLALALVGSRRSSERPEDLKPLREGQAPEGKGAFRSLFDW